MTKKKKIYTMSKEKKLENFDNIWWIQKSIKSLKMYQQLMEYQTNIVRVRVAWLLYC